MPNFSTILTQTCVLKPSFQLMQRAYEDYRVDSAPCKRGARNQCAARMSVALGRCGFSLDTFPTPRAVHRNLERCQVTIPHVMGAAGLATYLSRVWGAPERFQGTALRSAPTALRGRTGVVYFNNCFRREQGGPQVGDHIDLWNGTQYYNQIIHVGAGGDARAGAPLFAQSDAVWFFPLPR